MVKKVKISDNNIVPEEKDLKAKISQVKSKADEIIDMYP
jgi:predicted transcriptional regulator